MDVNFLPIPQAYGLLDIAKAYGLLLAQNYRISRSAVVGEIYNSIQ